MVQHFRISLPFLMAQTYSCLLVRDLECLFMILSWSILMWFFSFSVQFSHSVMSNSATAWTAACQASLSITNSWSLLKLMSIESVMPSNHLILCHPLLLLPSVFPSIRVFSNESDLCIRWPKYWSFSFNISPSNEHPGLILNVTFFLVFNSLKMVLKVKVLVSQLCPTLRDPMDGSMPGQNPLSMGFYRQEYWSGLPFPTPGIKPGSPALQADSLLSELPVKHLETHISYPHNHSSLIATNKHPES